MISADKINRLVFSVGQIITNLPNQCDAENDAIHAQRSVPTNKSHEVPDVAETDAIVQPDAVVVEPNHALTQSKHISSQKDTDEDRDEREESREDGAFA